MSWDYKNYFLLKLFKERTNPKAGAAITDQETLFELARANKCVFWNGKHRSAKWVLNMNFQQVVWGLKNGSFRHYGQKALPPHRPIPVIVQTLRAMS
jgi:hypothetical protein